MYIAMSRQAPAPPPVSRRLPSASLQTRRSGRASTALVLDARPSAPGVHTARRRP